MILSAKAKVATLYDNCPTEKVTSGGGQGKQGGMKV